MKKLGLIGGTGPEPTVEYCRGIVCGVLDCCGSGDCQGLAGYLLRGIRNLSSAGAQFAA